MKKEKELSINGYKLVLECRAMPEAYGVFLDNKEIGYLRLRHGYFAATYYLKDEDGEVVYDAEPKGQGEFDNDEREYYLNKAVEEIDKYIKKDIK